MVEVPSARAQEPEVRLSEAEGDTDPAPGPAEGGDFPPPPLVLFRPQ